MKHMCDKVKWLTLLFMLISFLCYRWSLAERFPNYDTAEEQHLREYVNTHNTYVISEQQSIRYNTPDEVDATDKYLYLDYGSSNCVDVHTLDGKFISAILLPDKKGGVNIRCMDNLAYVCDSRNNVYVFEGTTLINKLDPRSAGESGYDYAWFQAKEHTQKIIDGRLLKFDKMGNCILECDIPRNPHVINPLRSLIFVISLIIWLIVMFREIKHRFFTKE